MTSQHNYIVVSPVKDEEQYIKATLDSVARQTVRPSRWVIVDDGSRDQTSAILASYTEVCPWITVAKIDRDAKRRLGVAEICAFAHGYRLVRHLPHDFVVKLDCDVQLPLDYFEKLMAKFDCDQELGIASGIYLENTAGVWQRIEMPEYHAAGASKMIRTKCFRQIDGFLLCPGWDTVDEIKARAIGWNTAHYKDVAFYHLKPEGSASGYLRTAYMLGQIDYRTGVPWLFFTLKAFHRMMAGRYPLLSGLTLAAGYLRSAFSRTPSLVTGVEAKCYRRLLNRRLFSRIRNSSETDLSGRNQDA